MAKSNTASQKKSSANAAPVHKFRVAGVTASIWRNKNDDKVSYSVSVEKSYKDDADAWQTSQSYFTSDLLALAKAVDLAHSWIVAQYAKAANDAQED